MSWSWSWPSSLWPTANRHLSFSLSLSLCPPDFNYNTDGYEGDGAEDGKSKDGSETLPFIDESPTMSPQLCAPQGPDGEAMSPTPPGALLTGVRAHTHTMQRQVRASSRPPCYTQMLHTDGGGSYRFRYGTVTTVTEL